MLDMKMVVLFDVDACKPTLDPAVDDLADTLEGITSAPASPTTSSLVLTQLHTFREAFAASGGVYPSKMVEWMHTHGKTTYLSLKPEDLMNDELALPVCYSTQSLGRFFLNPENVNDIPLDIPHRGPRASPVSN